MDRKIFTDMRKWKDENRPEALLIKGARQVGKTYAVDEFIREEFQVHVKLDFYEHPEYKDIFEGDLSSETVTTRMELMIPGFKVVPRETVIFLDEIQFCPNARTALKYLAQDDRIRVIASGSLLGLDYRKVSSYPVGYETVTVMHPMDFEEFLWAVGITRDAVESMKRSIHERRPLGKAVLDSMDTYFRSYTAVGGMPEAVKTFIDTKNLGMVSDVHRKILNGYRNDIGKYSEPKDRNRIFAVFDSVPAQLSQESKKFRYSRVGYPSPATSERYAPSIQWMSDSGVGLLCRDVTNPVLPLESNADAKSFKMYLNDTGLLISMMSGDVMHAVLTGDTRTNRGAVTENAVACALTAAGVPLFYFSSKNFEIDFVMGMRGNVAAIEVKSGNNRRSKSLDSMKERYGTRRRIKFEETDITVTANGIEHYPLFCCAFVNDLYEPYDTVAAVPDPSDVNRLLTGDGKTDTE